MIGEVGKKNPKKEMENSSFLLRHKNQKWSKSGKNWASSEIYAKEKLLLKKEKIKMQSYVCIKLNPICIILGCLVIFIILLILSINRKCIFLRLLYRCTNSY